VGRADLAPATNSVGMRAIAEKRPASYGKAVASLRYGKTRVASRSHARSRAA
jgi:hypothetical protein